VSQQCEPGQVPAPPVNAPLTVSPTRETPSEAIVTGRPFMSDRPQTIVGENPDRRTVAIKNMHATDRVDIGPQGVTYGFGWPLDAGEGIVLNTRGAVYGVCAAGLAVELAVVQEVGG
jgi:hypothetical protein